MKTTCPARLWTPLVHTNLVKRQGVDWFKQHEWSHARPSGQNASGISPLTSVTCGSPSSSIQITLSSGGATANTLIIPSSGPNEANAVITGSPGTYPSFLKQVLDGQETKSTVEYIVVLQNVAPTYTGPLSGTVTSGTAASFNLSATGSPASTFTLVGAPAGWSVAGNVLSYSGAALPSGLSTFDIRTSNGVLPNDIDTFSLTVSLAAIPPEYTGATTVTVAQGTPFTIPLTAAGTGPFTYSLTGTVPAGISIVGNNLVGTSAVVGSGSFQIITTGAALPADTTTFFFSANPVVAVAISTASITTANKLVTANFDHNAIGGTGPYQWSIGGNNPAFTIDVNTGVVTKSNAI